MAVPDGKMDTHRFCDASKHAYTAVDQKTHVLMLPVSTMSSDAAHSVASIQLWLTS